MLKVAAIQMTAELSDVRKNLMIAEELIIKAAGTGAKLVLLPEFFTSAMGFDRRMLDVPIETGDKPVKLFRSIAAEKEIIVGGSYIRYDGSNAYNTFILVFPDGQVFFHDKDIPTQLENCYFTGGCDNGIFETPIGRIGVALCWEMIRYDTVRRLSGKIDFVLAGSCCWDLPEDAPFEREGLRLYNRKLANDYPLRFAQLLGVPLIHAGHAGKVRSLRFPAGDILQTRQLIGATQVIGSNGNILEKASFEEGCKIITASIDIEANRKQTPKIPCDSYWIPDLPDEYKKAWKSYNNLGRMYYQDTALPYYRKNFNQDSFS